MAAVALLPHTDHLWLPQVWNAGAMDSLDDLVSDGVVYSDVLAHDSDTFGRPGLRQAVQEFQAGHPLAHFTVVSHCPWSW